MEIDFFRLSKVLSYVLRHNPWDIGLELDGGGWTSVDALIEALKRQYKHFSTLTEKHLYEMNESYSKQRFQIENGRIRASYGHSFDQKVIHTPAQPPEILYHGTSKRMSERILSQGLKPQQRQYVHLSATEEIAMEVAQRWEKNPVILKIRTLDAHNEGIVFYKANDQIWLADMVPEQYIFI